MSGTESGDRAALRKLSHNLQRPPRLGPFVLGRECFARISAVEGIALTDDMRAMLNQFDHQGLSADERRRAIHQRFSDALTPEVNLAEAIRCRFAPLGGVELDFLPCESAREPPEFG